MTRTEYLDVATVLGMILWNPVLALKTGEEWLLKQPCLFYQSFIYRFHYAAFSPIMLVLVFNLKAEL